MTSGAERKYIILFAILIALTGFTFESQQPKKQRTLGHFQTVSHTPNTVTTISSQKQP